MEQRLPRARVDPAGELGPAGRLDQPDRVGAASWVGVPALVVQRTVAADVAPALRVIAL
jgi:hypothetical protein